MNTNKPTTMKILKGREKQGQFTLKPQHPDQRQDHIGNVERVEVV